MAQPPKLNAEPQTAEDYKRKRDRSPGYPGIDLETAILNAREFYAKEGRHFVPVTVAIKHWGFRAWSGSANVALAAPIKFGLMEDDGKGEQRKVRLTELGLRLAREGNPNRGADLREAALKPKIYQELWEHSEQQGGIPSDETLAWWLRERNFTENAIREFIPRFRSTVGYAELLAGGMVTEASSEGKVPPAQQPPQRLSPPTLFGAMEESRRMTSTPEGILQFPIPLPDTDQLAGLQVPTRMSEQAWNQMLAIINAFKPSIVQAPKKAASNDVPTDEEPS
jgi:hypothetical protein